MPHPTEDAAAAQAALEAAWEAELAAIGDASGGGRRAGEEEGGEVAGAADPIGVAQQAERLMTMWVWGKLGRHGGHQDGVLLSGQLSVSGGC